MPRKESLETDHIYHIFNRSIAGYVIFNDIREYGRMVATIRHYRTAHNPGKLSHTSGERASRQFKPMGAPPEKPIDMIAYCLMPTHFHLIVKQVSEGGISRFTANIQNSYTRYFNTKHRRKGPLWEGKFKNVLVKTDEQLLHLTRYIHLNPVTADLAALPEKWAFSSYTEYMPEPTAGAADPMCQKGILSDILPRDYRSFVVDHISAQKELAMIKHLLIE